MYHDMALLRTMMGGNNGNLIQKVRKNNVKRDRIKILTIPF